MLRVAVTGRRADHFSAILRDENKSRSRLTVDDRLRRGAGRTTGHFVATSAGRETGVREHACQQWRVCSSTTLLIRNSSRCLIKVSAYEDSLSALKWQVCQAPSTPNRQSLRYLCIFIPICHRCRTCRTPEPSVSRPRDNLAALQCRPGDLSDTIAVARPIPRHQAAWQTSCRLSDTRPPSSSIKPPYLSNWVPNAVGRTSALSATYGEDGTLFGASIVSITFQLSRPFLYGVQMEPLERSKPPSIASIHRSISTTRIAKIALEKVRRNQ